MGIQKKSNPKPPEGETPKVMEFAYAQDELNRLKRENNIDQKKSKNPVVRAIDAFFNRRDARQKQCVSRKTYLRLCILGMFGAHRFYTKQWGTAILYLLTCWTGFSAAMTLVDAITVAPMKPDENGNIMI